jgi:hypothetical protein
MLAAQGLKQTVVPGKLTHWYQAFDLGLALLAQGTSFAGAASGSRPPHSQ